jgi:poly(3-hydroxybutyrate) depolymerase
MLNPVPHSKARLPYRAGIALISLLIAMGAACHGPSKPVPQKPTEGGPGLAYSLIISPEDWGPAVKKIVVDAGSAIAPGKVGKDLFSVSLRAQAWDDKTRKAIVVERPRPVIDAYASDENGERSPVPGPYVALELPYHPADALSNPLFWDPADEYNKWKAPYAYTVTSSLLSAPATRFSGRICPQSDAFALDTFSSGGAKLSYAWFGPASAGKRPLIVWLHGAGEGGTDPSVTLLGNKVTSLASPEIQGFFGGAYVLVPQSPTVWMTQGGQRYDISEEARSSSYSPAVEALIRGFISSHPDIDDKRIYIGGCSNGGYMTVNLLLRNPGYFAAAFPVSEAFPDAWLGKEDIARLSRERIWFIASGKDASVDPKQYAQATVARLREAGAADVRLSLFGAVTDLTGKYKDGDREPYEYYGHWAWIRALNNECEDGGMSLMQWLASKSR